MRENTFTPSEREYYRANYLALNLPYVTSPEKMDYCMNIFEYVGETFQSAAVKIAYGHPVGDEGHTYGSLHEFALYLIDHIEVYQPESPAAFITEEIESDCRFNGDDLTPERLASIRAEVNRRIYENLFEFNGRFYEDLRYIKAPFEA